MTSICRCLVVTLAAFCTFVSMTTGYSPNQKSAGVTEVSSAQEVPQTVVKPAGQSIGERLATEPAKKSLVDRRNFNTSFLTFQEIYDPVVVPTYGGYSQTTHPKILYFPKRWNGYKYWMPVTPYPSGNDNYESPCIVTSNDGKTWVTPTGLKNPITGIPSNMKTGTHCSDSYLVMCGNKVGTWYRYNKGNPKTNRADSSMDHHYRTVSKGDPNWPVSQLMQKLDKDPINLAVNYEDKRYKLWYTTTQKQLIHTENVDGTTQSDPQQCSIELPEGYLSWHQDMIHYQNVYYLLQTGTRQRDYSFALFLPKSADGIHFTEGVPFYPSDNPVVLHKTQLYRSTIYVGSDMLYMMILYHLPQKKWYIAATFVSVQRQSDAYDLQEPLILPDPIMRALTQKKTEERTPQKIVPSLATQMASEKIFAQTLPCPECRNILLSRRPGWGFLLDTQYGIA